MAGLSLFYPANTSAATNTFLPETVNDLSVETICDWITKDEKEKILFINYMSRITDDAHVARYRCEIFQDVLEHPNLRSKMLELLEKVDFMESYKDVHMESDASSIWDLVHRLAEIRDYITCVDDIYHLLSGLDLHSEGLLGLRSYIEDLYQMKGFDALRKDTAELSRDLNKIRSVTLGVNLNDRFEPHGVGVVSVNEKPYSKTGILSNFCDFLVQGDSISKGTGPVKSRTFHTYTDVQDIILPKKMRVASSDNPLQMLDKITSNMLSGTVKQLKRTLAKHVDISMYDLSRLIPEFTFYVRWAEWMEKKMAEGYWFCKPEVLDTEKRELHTEGIYNLKLTEIPSRDIVENDFLFDAKHRLYILTGANRGGKTTITQAVALAFWLAQNGIYVPAKSFQFSPADQIFTHFPADENKTVGLGRLGEESDRFRKIYQEATSHSLILLNESFSTTSFEEGYYIAKDVMKALKILGVRVIFNSHMHKLAENLEEFNASLPGDSEAASMIVQTQEGQRSYKVILAEPEGQSYAMDIARKYGVTFEQLRTKLKDQMQDFQES